MKYLHHIYPDHLRPYAANVKYLPHIAENGRMTVESVAAALYRFAPDYPYAEIVAGSTFDNGKVLVNGREYASYKAAVEALPGHLFVMADASYIFVNFPGSNSDGIVQSEAFTDSPLASMVVDGGFYY